MMEGNASSLITTHSRTAQTARRSSDLLERLRSCASNRANDAVRLPKIRRHREEHNLTTAMALNGRTVQNGESGPQRIRSRPAHLRGTVIGTVNVPLPRRALGIRIDAAIDARKVEAIYEAAETTRTKVRSSMRSSQAVQAWIGDSVEVS